MSKGPSVAEFAQLQLLNDRQGPAQTLAWDDSDTEDLFQKNLAEQGQKWFYAEEPVSYVINSQGYRAPELDLIDWSNSLVIWGCSTVYGTGLSEKDTVTQQLSRLIHKPVINMGRPGTSMMWSRINQLQLLAQGHRPRAVINCWTAYDRVLEITRWGLMHQGRWNRHLSLYASWNRNMEHALIMARAEQQIVQQIYQALNIPHIEMSFFGKTAQLLGCHNAKTVDLARDLSHPGRLSAQRIAAELAEKLKKQNL